MRKVSFFTLLLLLSQQMLAQKNDNIWVLGYWAEFDSTDCGINFINGQPDTFSLHKKMIFGNTDASICDAAGNLLFYTNGQEIASRKHKPLLNSAHFNPGYFSDTLYTAHVTLDSIIYTGLLCSQSCLVLPTSDSNKYYIFNSSADYFFSKECNCQSFDPFSLRYSIVNMQLDSGYGGNEANRKSIPIVQDTILIGRITAVRHADGKRWWVAVHKQSSDLVYKILVSDTGINVDTQHIGVHYYEITELPQFPTQFIKSDLDGQAYFSPDGTKYAMTGWESKILLMDFNRCTGEFSKIHSFKTPIVDTSLVVPLGCSFSPNSRYLYVNTYQRLYQYDTWNNNLDSADAVEVLHYDYLDTAVLPYRLFLHSEQIAPDNKIYINTWGGSKFFSVINYPDSAGLSCHAIQNQLHIPQYNGAIPNFTNYRLKALPIYKADAGRDTTIIQGQHIMLGIATVGGVTYSWQPVTGLDNITIAQPTASPEQTTTYYCTITDNNSTGNCTDRIDSVIVYVADAGCDLKLPTLLHEGDNYFKLGYSEHFSINCFNMLGQLVYVNDDYMGEWKPEIRGMYLVKVRCENGDMRVRKLVVE